MFPQSQDPMADFASHLRIVCQVTLVNTTCCIFCNILYLSFQVSSSWKSLTGGVMDTLIEAASISECTSRSKSVILIRVRHSLCSETFLSQLQVAEKHVTATSNGAWAARTQKTPRATKMTAKDPSKQRRRGVTHERVSARYGNDVRHTLHCQFSVTA